MSPERHIPEAIEAGRQALDYGLVATIVLGLNGIWLAIYKGFSMRLNKQREDMEKKFAAVYENLMPRAECGRVHDLEERAAELTAVHIAETLSTIKKEVDTVQERLDRVCGPRPGKEDKRG